MDKLPKISPELKKSIAYEWLDLFPELSLYKPTMLLCRNGPVLVGIEFQWLMGNTQYRPQFVLFLICPSPNTKDLAYSFLYPFNNDNNLTLDLNIEQNSLTGLFNGNKEKIRSLILKQCLISFEYKITANELADIILYNLRVQARITNINQKGIYNTLLYLAGLIKENNPKYAEEIFEEAIAYLKKKGEDKYSRSISEKAYGKTYESIIESFYHNFNNLDYQQLIKDTIVKFKLDKIKSI